jgi:hypothetical protein
MQLFAENGTIRKNSLSSTSLQRLLAIIYFKLLKETVPLLEVRGNSQVKRFINKLLLRVSEDPAVKYVKFCSTVFNFNYRINV